MLFDVKSNFEGIVDTFEWHSWVANQICGYKWQQRPQNEHYCYIEYQTLKEIAHTCLIAESLHTLSNSFLIYF